MIDVGYYITSTKDYYQKTLSLLLSSIREDRKNKFLVIVSNFPETKEEIIDGFKFLFTSNHRFAWSGLAELINRPQEYKYYFGMPCTAKLGPKFFDLVENFIDEDWDCIRGSEGQDSLGTFSWNYIMNQKDWVLSRPNNKTIEVQEEATFLLNAKHFTRYTRTDFHVLGYDDVYKTGTTRMIGYYPGLDFYKFKANWGQTSPLQNWILTP